MQPVSAAAEAMTKQASASFHCLLAATKYIQYAIMKARHSRDSRWQQSSSQPSFKANSNSAKKKYKRYFQPLSNGGLVEEKRSKQKKKKSAIGLKIGERLDLGVCEQFYINRRLFSV